MVRIMVQRVNKQNQFVPSAVLTRTGKIPVSTARQKDTAVKPSAVVIGDTKIQLATMSSKYNGGSNLRKLIIHIEPLKNKGGPLLLEVVKDISLVKVKLNTVSLDFEDVCCKEHQHFNPFSESTIMWTKRNKVLFTDSECLVLSSEFKLPDEDQEDWLVYLQKLQPEESNNWLGGKQHKASCKAKTVSSISHSLQLLHMDLFGPTSVRSLNHKTYCLVITDDFSRFSWVFFLRTKDETSAILKDFIRQIENQLNQKVKTIRCDNGTEFKNKDVIEFCGSKGIKREYSNARTPQQNRVAERKNRTLIEAARTMLADSFLPNTFWAEAVSTACYVLNRVLVTKPHNMTPYELLTGKIPIISYIRPFGCHVTILNTIDHLGKFAGKSDEGFLVGYSLQSKAFRVYNLETKRVEENLNITFLENKLNVAGKGPTWLFDLDYLTDSMNYHPVRSENQANLHAGQQEANQNAGTEDITDAGDSEKEDESAQDCFVLPIWPSYSSTITPVLKTDDKREGPREEEQVFMDELERLKRQEKEANEEAEALRKEFEQETENLVIQEGAAKTSSTNIFSTVSTPAKASSTNLVNTVSIPVNTASPHEGLSLSDLTNPEEDDSEIPPLEDIYQNSTDGIFTTSSYDDEGAVADFTNLETVVNVSPIPTSRIHSSHPSALILGDPTSAVQTRSKVNTSSGAHAFVSYVQKQKRTNHKDFHHCLFACFLSQHEPKKISEALEDESWVDAMQEELLQFEIQKVWILVDLPFGKKAIGTKWVYRNKKDERGVVVRNKARLVAQGHRQEEGIDYDEMSSMGELTFFLRLQVKQKADGIFISQDKRPLVNDEEAIDMDVQSSYKTSFLAMQKATIVATTTHNKQNMLLLQAAVGRGLIVFRESLRRVTDGTEALLIPTLFILWLDKVSTDSAKGRGGESLISLFTTITLPTTMVVLESCPKHNMVAYLEKSKGNAEFHEIIDFLKRSSIHHALTGKSPLCLLLCWNNQLRMRVLLQKDHLKHNLPLEQQTDPSPRPSPSPIIPDPIPETSGGNLGGHSSSDKSLSGNEGEMTLQSVYDLCLSLCAQSMAEKCLLEAKIDKKELPQETKGAQRVCIQPREEVAKVHHHFKEILYLMRFLRYSMIKLGHRECSDKGRYNDIVDEDKEIEENVLSTEDVLSTDKDKVSTDKEKVSTDRPMVSTDGSKVSTDRQVEGTDEQIEGTEEQIESTDGKRKGTEEGSATQLTQIPTSTIFGDDETIAKVLLNTSQAKAVSREKEKAKMIQKTKEEEIKKRLNLKENSESDIDFLLRTLQEPRKERNLTIDRKSKVPVMTQFAPKKIPLLNKIRSNRNRPLTKNQLRNQMMTYLKHVGNFKHAELKIKKFEEVQALYEKIKRSDEDFISIGSAEDERLIQRMNEKGVDSSKDEMIKEESKEEVKKESKAEVQEKSKEEESKRKRKFGTRKKIKSRKRRYIQNTSEDDSDKENDELRLHLTIAPDEKKEVDYEILDRKYPIKEWKTKCLGTKPQADKAEHLEEINQNVVIRSNGQKRYFSTLMRVLSIFDREDLNAVYQLVMDRFQDEIPKGFDKSTRGELWFMYNPVDER
ncbi:putative ribonuclease H-like domain-containing protein [Tanacetum coccineum]